jgi:hypothetical protein
MDKILKQCPVCRCKKIIIKIDIDTKQKIYMCSKCPYTNMEKITKKFLKSITFKEASSDGA